jgi:Cdc6-like AAA superfamily ATPase
MSNQLGIIGVTPEPTGAMTTEDSIRLFGKVAASFSPSAPIDQQALFAGRIPQFVEVINAVGQKGQHVILYGERGVGKTSLAKVISSFYQSQGAALVTVSVNCDATMDFSTMWRTALREVPVALGQSPGIGFTAQTSSVTNSLAALLPEVATPDEIRFLLQRVGKTIIVFDELDRIRDEHVSALLADTIKNLSDHAVDTTLILVGVADSVNALIGEHLSVERALVQVQMPRMNQTELEEIVQKGAAKSGMTYDPVVSSRIATISQGLPHYVHLLALHAFRAAIERRSTRVELVDLRKAMERAVGHAQASTVTAYHKATASVRENLYAQVLLACALAGQDDLGYFAAADVREPMSRIMKRAYDIPAFAQHLNAFCEEERGCILQKVGLRRGYRFRFVNPLMQPFVIMNGLSKEFIAESDVPAR